MYKDLPHSSQTFRPILANPCLFHPDFGTKCHPPSTNIFFPPLRNKFLILFKFQIFWHVVRWSCLVNFVDYLSAFNKTVEWLHEFHKTNGLTCFLSKTKEKKPNGKTYELEHVLFEKKDRKNGCAKNIVLFWCLHDPFLLNRFKPSL